MRLIPDKQTCLSRYLRLLLATTAAAVGAGAMVLAAVGALADLQRQIRADNRVRVDESIRKTRRARSCPPHLPRPAGGASAGPVVHRNDRIVGWRQVMLRPATGRHRHVNSISPMAQFLA
jgi:hypothetical protein